MDASLFVAFGAAIAAGGMIGWWVRGQRHGTERRMLEELYMRKVRLAEKDRDTAVESLNKNRLEMRRVQSRFEGYTTQIASLEREMSVTKREAASARGRLDERDRQMADAQAIVETARETSERIRMEASKALSDRDTFVTEIESLRKEVADRDVNLTETRQETGAIRAQLEEARAELRHVREGAEQKHGELNQVSTSLEEREARVEKLTAELDELSGELAQRSQRLTELMEKVHVLEARIAEQGDERTKLEGTLEASEMRVREQESELDSLRNEFDRFKQSLEQRLERGESTLQMELGEKQKLAGALGELKNEFDGRASELAQTNERNAELSRTIEERDKEVKQQSALLEETQTELERTEERLSLLQPVSVELEKSRRTEKELGERLERETKKLVTSSDRIEKLDERFSKLKEDSAVLKTELKEAKSHNNSLASSHKAVQLKVDRLNQTIVDLKERIAGRDEKIKELQSQHRERGVELKALEGELRKASSRSASTSRPQAKKSTRRSVDDLKRINGIGPAIEKKLHRLGIRTFEQLSDLARDEVDELAGKLGIGAQRIRQERWVTAAKRELRLAQKA